MFLWRMGRDSDLEITQSLVSQADRQTGLPDGCCIIAVQANQQGRSGEPGTLFFPGDRKSNKYPSQDESRTTNLCASKSKD